MEADINKGMDLITAEILTDQQNAAKTESARALASIAQRTVAAAKDPEITEKKKYRVFKTHMPNSQYVTRRGIYVTFPDGLFATQDPSLIAELEYEIEKRHPQIYIDPEYKYSDVEITSVKAATRARLKEEIRQEVLRDMGYTDAVPTLKGIKNSEDVAVLDGNSNSPAVNPTLLATLKGLPKATGR